MAPISGELTFRETVFKANFCSLEHFEEVQWFFKYAETHLRHFLLGLIVPGIVGLILVIEFPYGAGSGVRIFRWGDTRLI